ncbi:MAG: type III-A CRISPR-associated RAMP protein Csm5 [Candidatus Ancillula sp.]|jgi:CRISPR-associated protein Csm5|nr:type III-A CRISPR-associated RAMP protein Csm5 [Candidatus Ancillula sp.]
MREFIKRYRLSITTIGPVHIGSGQKYNSKEYIFDREKNEVYFPDIVKLYAYLDDAKKNSFEQFMMRSSTQDNQSDMYNKSANYGSNRGYSKNNTRSNKGQQQQNQGAQRLQSWVKNNITRSITNDHKGQWGGYTLDIGTIGKDKNGNSVQLNEIDAFIKNGFGRPYIPGSSVKGMLRTIFLKYYALQNLSDSKEPPFNIRVSDSREFENSNLIVLQKRDIQFDKEKPSSPPVFRECINSVDSNNDYNVFNFDVSVDMTQDGVENMCGFIKNLEKIAEKVYEEYLYQTEQYEKYREENDLENETGAYFFLGGGSGILSKTYGITDKEIADVLSNNRGFQKAKHKEFYQKNGFSPKVLKTAEHGWVTEMGQVSLSVEEVG